MKKGLALGLGLFAALAMTAGTAKSATIEELVASGDVVITSEALEGGASISLIANPEEIEAGAPPFVPPGHGGTPPGQGGTAPGQGGGIGGGNGGGGNGGGGNGGGGGAPGGGSGTIVNGDFSSDLSGWTANNAVGGLTTYGPISAPGGSSDGAFAAVHTGLWDKSTQGSLEQGLMIGTNQSSVFSVVYNFVSTEWAMPGGGRNDNATVTLTGPAGNLEFSLLESVSTSAWTPVNGLPYLQGWGNQNGGETGWISSQSGTLLLSPGNYTIRIEVNDVIDGFNDSAILVDSVRLQ